MRTPDQFSISHYCEKSCWHLDHKGLGFQVDNLFPGLHRLKSARLAGIVTLPILKDGEQVIGDSTQIALYLETHYPDHPLLPADAAQRAEVLELEDGRRFVMTAGMSYQVADQAEAHRSSSATGARLFIVD
jgi:glutathione S-transferase